jgi:hypothetical protein
MGYGGGTIKTEIEMEDWCPLVTIISISFPSLNAASLLGDRKIAIRSMG